MSEPMTRERSHNFCQTRLLTRRVVFSIVRAHERQACESIRFSFALRRWGRFAKRPQRRRAKEKRMLSQANERPKMQN